MSLVQLHAQKTIEYLEEDLISYEAVFNERKLPGKLGVGMITNAMAALDSFAWLLYQTLDQKLSTRDLFKKLITDSRFFTTTDFKNEKLLYGIVRCGVVHQYYAKNIDIVARDNHHIFMQIGGKRAAINALGLYRKTLEGLRKFAITFLHFLGKTLMRWILSWNYDFAWMRNNLKEQVWISARYHR